MKIPGFGLIFRYDYVLNSNFKTVNPQIVENAILLLIFILTPK